MISVNDYFRREGLEQRTKEEAFQLIEGRSSLEFRKKIGRALINPMEECHSTELFYELLSTDVAGSPVIDYLESTNGELKRWAMEIIVRECDPLQHRKILDAGCGSGLEAVFLALHGANVTGVDASQGYINAAMRRATKYNVAAEFRKGDFTNIPFPTETFERTLFVNSLNNCEIGEDGIVQALHEAYRVLIPGGKIICIVTLHGAPELESCCSQEAPNYFWTMALQDCGFKSTRSNQSSYSEHYGTFFELRVGEK